MAVELGRMELMEWQLWSEAAREEQRLLSLELVEIEGAAVEQVFEGLEISGFEHCSTFHVDGIDWELNALSSSIGRQTGVSKRPVEVSLTWPVEEQTLFIFSATWYIAYRIVVVVVSYILNVVVP